jgi:hypothetical protein
VLVAQKAQELGGPSVTHCAKDSLSGTFQLSFVRGKWG